MRESQPTEDDTMTDSKSEQRSKAKRKGAGTERKGRAAAFPERDAAKPNRPIDVPIANRDAVHSSIPDQETPMTPLHAQTQAKFVLFNIPAAERVAGGPVMRGFLEIASGEEGGEPTKIQVAGWAELARDTGRDYLSLKVANTEGEGREVYTVGPFYGRLFKHVTKTANGETVRYFGFIEDAERVGEDEHGRGVYERHWELAIRAKRAVSHDGRTVYISGHVGPRREASVRAGEIAF